MARPKKKKIFGGIIIIVGRADEELDDNITGGIWNRLANAVGEALAYDEDGPPAQQAIVDAAVAIADAVAPEGPKDPDLESLLADLDSALAAF